MIWVIRPLKILQVTRYARGIGDVVVSINVALSTLRAGMSTRERKSALGMIELRRLPGGRAVTNLTLLRQSG